MDFESMMRGLKKPETRVIFGEELSDFAKAFVRITDLKPGDKVKWRSKAYRDASIPETNEIVEVLNVFPPMRGNEEYGSNHFTDAPDFSFAFMANGIYYESAADSRRFVKVE